MLIPCLIILSPQEQDPTFHYIALELCQATLHEVLFAYTAPPVSLFSHAVGLATISLFSYAPLSVIFLLCPPFLAVSGMCGLLFHGLCFYTQYVEKPDVASTILVEPLHLLRQSLSGVAHLHTLGIGNFCGHLCLCYCW